MKFIFERFEDIEDIRVQIEECEGKHTQQVCYSTFHGALTQICFDCMRVRSNIDWKEKKVGGKT